MPDARPSNRALVRRPVRGPISVPGGVMALVAAVVIGCSGPVGSAEPGQTSGTASAGPSSEATTPTPAGPRASSGAASATPASIPAVAIRVTEPYVLTAQGSTVWVIAGTDLARIDVTTNAVEKLGVSAGQALDGFAATPSAVWVADFDGSQVLKVDTTTGKVVDRIPTGAAEDVLPVKGAVWVTNHHEGTVSRIDARTDKVVATVVVGTPGPGGPQQLAEGLGSIWIGETNTRQVIRLNPTTGAVVAKIAMPPAALPCGGIVTTDSAVWVSGCFETPTVVRIDPRTNAVVATIRLDGFATGLVVVDGAVWAPVGGDGYGLTSGDGYQRELERINPDTNSVDRKLPLPALNDAWRPAVAAGDLWLPNGVDTILRVPLSELATP